MVYPITLISELSQYMDKTMMVLLTGYGKQVFGRGVNGASEKYFRIHYAIRLV